MPEPKPRAGLSLVEFPADDAERARRFWTELLGAPLEPRQDGEGEGWQTRAGSTAIGVHERGQGPGDTRSLPYFAVADLAESLARVEALGGSVIHPGERWAICRDSEGSPFALALDAGAERPLRSFPVTGELTASEAIEEDRSER